MDVPKDVTSAELGSGPQRARSVDDFALVVGIDHYPRFKGLNGAVEDARAFHTWVCDPMGGGIDPSRARLIESNPTPATPVQQEIDQAFLELMQAADKLGGGRRLYFYFSGHGIGNQRRSADVSLLLASWSENLARTGLSSDRYRSLLQTTGLFEEVAIFLDCCRTTNVRAVGLPPTMTFRRQSDPRPTAVFLAYATTAGSPAFEQPHDGAWHGVFTRTLLSILRRSGGIEARLLKDQLKSEVRGAGARQEPVVVDGFDRTSFGIVGKQPRLEIRFATYRGPVQLQDGFFAHVANHVAAEAPWIRDLQMGLYKLVRPNLPTVIIDHNQETTLVDLA